MTLIDPAIQRLAITMSIPDALPLSPPSTSSRRKTNLLSSSMNGTNTPDSSASFPGSSNTGNRKRVGFSTSADVHRPIFSSQPLSSAGRTWSDSHSGLRSILKPVSASENTIHTPEGSQEVEQSLSEMMDSFIELLARNDRTLSVDAYQTLANVLRQYDDIPEEDVLKEKIPMFMKYIKRDLLRKPSPDEPSIADTNLMTQALRLLIIFVWNKDYASLLPDESRAFILDRCVHVLAEHTAPKSVVLHHLHLLAAQNFRPTLVTSHRVVRLLEALKPLSEHYNGHSLVSERLLVYQKLLDQARPTMKAKAALWTEELLTAMTNGLKDIRLKAIDFGLKACSAFPASSSISAVIKSTLAKELENQKTFSSNMCHKLEKLLTVKEAGVQVPQIWTIVLTLCNNVDGQGRNGWGPHCDKWPQFKDWLGVIQKSFNCGDSAIRQQTYQAWNRFIHIVQPHLASDNLLEMLVKPVASKLEGHGGDSATKGSRTIAVSSYCTLLYYAFRPSAKHEQYTRVWNEYIMKVMKTSFFEKGPANADIASRIFMALFWNSKRATKIWNDTRALENTLVEPEELPTIDCKWIRSKARAILDVFRVLMRYSSWGASGRSEKAHIFVAWVHFLKALREAGRKEIKPSPETIEAMIHLTSFLARSYLQLPEHVDGGRPEKARSLSAAQVRQLTMSATIILGGDLIMAGLGDKGYSLSKALVIYDALDTNSTEANQMEDPSSTIFNACNESLNSALAHDFKLETATGTNVGIDQLQERFGGMAMKQILHTMKLLKTPISLILKDNISGWKDQHDRSRRYPKIITTTLTLLSKLPATAVEEIDEILAGLFGSTHKLVVEDTVAAWNQQFGQLPSLTLGPMLSQTFTRLQDSGLKIMLSGRLLRDHPKQREFPSQSTPTSARLVASPRHISPAPNTEFMRAEFSPDVGSQDFHNIAPKGQAAAQSSSHAPASRPLSRYDDSQVHFVPIESSPLPHEEPESQSLTVHQKDVRERQCSEPAVVFADLRSSPRLQTKSITRTDCEFGRKAASQSERPTTPTLPTNDDRGDAEILASPTPRSRHIANLVTDIEVPSSPPSMMGNNDRHEITSSPPPVVAAEFENAIDLVMEQVEVAEEDDTMEIDESEALQTTEGDSVAEASLTNELSLERFQSNPQKVPSRGHRDQGDTAGKCNVQPDGRSLQASEDSEAVEFQEDSDVVLQNDHGVDDIEEDLPRSDAILSSSLRPITINLASDSTTAEGPENIESSPTKQVRTDSDEIDMLSASQLSHDLDQHISQTAGTDVDESQLEAKLETESERQEDDNEPSQRKHRSRKRKSSSQKFTAAKRRKPSQPQRSSNSIERDTSVYNTPGEMLDCIEISPSLAVQAISISDLNAPTPAPKRPRGRPRKRPLDESIEPETSHIKKETMDEQGAVGAALPEHDRPDKVDQVLDQDVGMEFQEVASTLATHSVEKSVMEELIDAVPLKDSTAPDIIASLQNVLDRLKSANSTEIDLKEVDDLCFQIRFQAQVVAHQRGA